jgi:hypothetical protein
MQVDGFSGLDEALQESLTVLRRTAADSIHKKNIFRRRPVGVKVCNLAGDIRGMAQRSSDPTQECSLV